MVNDGMWISAAGQSLVIGKTSKEIRVLTSCKDVGELAQWVEQQGRRAEIDGESVIAHDVWVLDQHREFPVRLDLTLKQAIPITGCLLSSTIEDELILRSGSLGYGLDCPTPKDVEEVVRGWIEQVPAEVRASHWTVGVEADDHAVHISNISYVGPTAAGHEDGRSRGVLTGVVRDGSWVWEWKRS